MAAYKLTYFPCRARGELIRLIFAQAGVEYENVRLTFFPMGSPQWDAMKKTLSTVGQTLPILEVEGHSLSGHVCIARYLAEKFGLAGENSLDNAELAGIAESMADGWTAVLQANFQQKTEQLKEEKCNEVYGTYLPTLFSQVDSVIAKNGHTQGWVWGQKMTYADLAIYHLFSHMVTLDETAPVRYPNVGRLYHSVQQQPLIAKWVKERPHDII